MPRSPEGLAIRHALQRRGVENELADRAAKYLSRMEADIASRIIQRDTVALRGLLAEIPSLAESTMRDIYEDQVYQLTRYGEQFAVGAENELLSTAKAVKPDVKIARGLATAAVIKSAVENEPMHGALLRDWWSNLGPRTALRLNQQIQLGIGLNESVPDIVRRVRGTHTGAYRTLVLRDGTKKRYGVFKGGAMKATTREAEAIVRTSVADVMQQARKEVYQQNSDIASMYQYVATLDDRTTDICIALDGRKFKWGEGPEPPQHWNCRSTTIPVIDYQKLGIKEDELPTGLRAARDPVTGKTTFVKGDTTYGDWLRAQPESVQAKVLGKERAQLWRDGKVSLQDMVAKDGRRLSLDELKSIVAKDTRAIAPDLFAPAVQLTRDELVSLLTKYNGNLTQAGKSLGINGATVRNYAKKAGLDVNAFRKGVKPGVKLLQSEKERIIAALRETGGHMTKSQKILKMSPETMRRRMKQYGIDKNDYITGAQKAKPVVAKKAAATIDTTEKQRMIALAIKHEGQTGAIGKELGVNGATARNRAQRLGVTFSDYKKGGKYWQPSTGTVTETGTTKATTTTLKQWRDPPFKDDKNESLTEVMRRKRKWSVNITKKNGRLAKWLEQENVKFDGDLKAMFAAMDAQTRYELGKHLEFLVWGHGGDLVSSEQLQKLYVRTKARHLLPPEQRVTSATKYTTRKNAIEEASKLDDVNGTGYAKEMFNRTIEAWGDEIPDDVYKVIQALPKINKVVDGTMDSGPNAGSYYQSMTKLIRMSDYANDGRRWDGVFIHEFGHHADYAGNQLLVSAGRRTTSGGTIGSMSSFEEGARFRTAIDAFRKRVAAMTDSEYDALASKIRSLGSSWGDTDWFANFHDLFYSVTHGVQNRRLGSFGHTENYYKRKSAKFTETYANTFMLWAYRTRGSSGVKYWKFMETYAPELANAMKADMAELIEVGLTL